MSADQGNTIRTTEAGDAHPRAWDFRWTKRSGAPVRSGDYTVTPESQALEIYWPGGGFVWNHPSAVIIEHDGAVERAPIRDETRAAQLAALTLSLIAAVLALWTWVIARSDSDEHER